MFDLIPSEIPIGGVLVPPALLAWVLGFVVTWAVTRILNRTRISRFFWYPQLAFLAMWVLASVIIGIFFFSP